jgi:DNA-binding NtrC family response regulator
MKKLRLLLVDDEQEFVETLADRLKMRDLDASIACNAEEALSAIAQEEPDVIVLDLKMPGIHGIEVLRRVKQAYPNVEVIILTGHGSKKDEEAARRLGAFDYVKKPADLDSLVSRVRNAFKQKISKLEKTFMAAAFAEEGEYDTAKKVMEEEEKEEKDEAD